MYSLLCFYWLLAYYFKIHILSTNTSLLYQTLACVVILMEHLFSVITLNVLG
jgi:hypothetical protein